MGRAKCAGCGKYGPDRCTCENFRKVAKKKEKTEKTPNPTVVPKGNAVPSPTASSSSTPTTRHKTERQLELELEIEKNRTQRALALSKCLDAVKAQNERQAAVKAAEAREKEKEQGKGAGSAEVVDSRCEPSGCDSEAAEAAFVVLGPTRGMGQHAKRWYAVICYQRCFTAACSSACFSISSRQ